MQVSRVYHLRSREFGSRYSPPNAKGGACVLATGEVGSNQVSVRVTFCRPDESYNKKLGRQYAEESQEKVIPLRKLPGFLGQTYREVLRRSHIRVHRHLNEEMPRFDSRIFDFLPKELA